MSESQSLAEAIRMMLELQAGPARGDCNEESPGQNAGELLRDIYFPKLES